MQSTTVIQKFLPTDWLDEVTPEPQVDVNAFLHVGDGIEFIFAPAKDDAHFGDRFYVKPIAVGDVVEFSALEIYDDFTIDVYEDSFVCSPEPTVANCFRWDDGDSEDVFNTVEELVANGPDGLRMEPGTYRIENWWWSDETFRYRLVVTDGKARLEPIPETSPDNAERAEGPQGRTAVGDDSPPRPERSGEAATA